MNCPLCNTTAAIIGTKAVLKDGEYFTRRIYACRNKKCSNYENQLDEEEFIPLEVEEIE